MAGVAAVLVVTPIAWVTAAASLRAVSRAARVQNQTIHVPRRNGADGTAGAPGFARLSRGKFPARHGF
jgi:hypothetical protein